MDGDKLIRSVYEAADSRADRFMLTEMRTEMAKILQSEGYFVAETTDELRELALTDTDLVEPSDE